jgi:hypothetical protein
MVRFGRIFTKIALSGLFLSSPARRGNSSGRALRRPGAINPDVRRVTNPFFSRYFTAQPPHWLWRILWVLHRCVTCAYSCILAILRRATSETSSHLRRDRGAHVAGTSSQAEVCAGLPLAGRMAVRGDDTGGGSACTSSRFLILSQRTSPHAADAVGTERNRER